MIIEVQHDCKKPWRKDSLNDPLWKQVNTVTREWRCEECGQRWRIKEWRGHGEAQRLETIFPNFKLRRWKRKQIAEIRESL